MQEMKIASANCSIHLFYNIAPLFMLALRLSPHYRSVSRMGSIGFLQVSVVVSVILTEKISLHVGLFFSIKMTELLNRTPDGSVDLA